MRKHGLTEIVAAFPGTGVLELLNAQKELGLSITYFDMDTTLLDAMNTIDIAEFNRIYTDELLKLLQSRFYNIILIVQKHQLKLHLMLDCIH